MLRFIIKRKTDNMYGCIETSYETIDTDVPEIEHILFMRGGKYEGGPGYDISELTGVELLKDTTK